MKTDPLLGEMTQQTEEIAENDGDQPKHDPADFDPDPAEQPAEQPAQDPEAEPAQDPEAEPAQDPAAQAKAEPITESEAERDAEFYIGCFDTLQTLILPSVYKGVLLTRDERIAIRNLRKRFTMKGKKITIDQLTEEEKALLDKFDEIEQLGDLVPYTDEESAAIMGPLAEILVKYNLKGSPEMRLIMALSIPTAMRMAPLLSVAI